MDIPMTLYNCRTDLDGYRITKFDSDMNVESSYHCTDTTCDCPAGQRPMCRHREMLPAFIGRGAVDKGWFLNYDEGGWYEFGEPEALGSPNIEPEPQPLSRPLPPAHYPSWRRI
jgi:hypothetical protein